MSDLNFEDKAIRVIERDGKQWVSAADIARALGYAESGKVTRLYDRHNLEFSPSMTMLMMLQDHLDAQSGHAGQMRTVRVFSLRGAHLVGMLARTRKAQAFRVWVLDIIEAHHDNKSLIQEFYEAYAERETEKRFASLCGKGLSQWRKIAPVLNEKTQQLMTKLQPSLLN